MIDIATTAPSAAANAPATAGRTAPRSTPWRAMRTAIDVLLLLAAAAPVVFLDAGKTPLDQLKASIALLALVVLPAVLAGGRGYDPESDDASDTERIIERLAPLSLVPSLIGLLFFPTFAAWGALELCLMVCCPLAFFLNLPRVRALFLLHCGLAAAGSVVLTAQAAYFVPLFSLALLLGLAIDRFEQVHEELPHAVPPRAAVSLAVGAGAFFLVAFPAYQLALLLLPAWERDLVGEGLPQLANTGDPPPPFVQEISIGVGLFMLIWMFRQLLDGGGEATAVKTSRDDEIEDLLPPEIVELESAPSGKRRAAKSWPEGRRAVIDAWLGVERALSKRGWIRGAGEAPRAFAAAVAAGLGDESDGKDGREAVLALAVAFDRARYGREEPAEAEVAAVRGFAERAVKSVKGLRGR